MRRSLGVLGCLGLATVLALGIYAPGGAETLSGPTYTIMGSTLVGGGGTGQTSASYEVPYASLGQGHPIGFSMGLTRDVHAGNIPIYARLGLDSDGDGLPNDGDNCPFASNAGQQDTGGINSFSSDGIGNACQCGDVTGNGNVNGQDGTFMTRHGLGYNDPIFVNGGNCDVNGNGQCNGQDGFFTTRAGLGYNDPPNVAPQGQNCHNADPAAPPCPTCSPCPSGTCS